MPYKHSLHHVWYSMKDRCLRKKNKRYCDYGGRGITVCDEWLSYMPFYNWAIRHYSPGLHLDRADNDKGYSPDNCRFVPPTTNANNKRTTVVIEAFGEKKAIAEWLQDERCKVKAKLLQERIRTGWHGELAITTPSMGRHGRKGRPAA